MTAIALVRHEESCPRRGFGHSDAAKRISDAINLHIAAIGWQAAGKVMAFGLADGGSDGVLYDTYEAAVRHQHGNEQRFFYLRVAAAGMPVCHAEAVFSTWRKMAGAGFRTDAGRVPIPRLTREDHGRQMAALGH